MGTLSSILSGLGKGLQQAGSMGLEYTFNSKLQGERLAAEQKRQLRITEIEQQGATVRMDKQIAAENLRGDRSLKQDEMQFGESMKRIESQLELARVGNDLTRQKLLIEEKNALTAELAAKSNARLDTVRGKVLEAGADLKGKDISRKELTDIIKTSSATYKTVSKEIEDNVKNGVNDPKKMQMLYDQQGSAMRTRDTATAALAAVASGGVGAGEKGDHLTPSEQHPDRAAAVDRLKMSELVSMFVNNPGLLKPGEQYDKLLRDSQDISPSEFEKAKGLAILKMSKGQSSKSGRSNSIMGLLGLEQQ